MKSATAAVVVLSVTALAPSVAADDPSPAPDSTGWAETVSLKDKMLERHADIVGVAAFRPDGTRIVTASGDGTARVWWFR